jgi:hypothetical protein
MATLGRSPGAAPLTSADIPDNSITAAKIATDTIVAGDVAADAIGASELANDAVAAANIIDGSVGTTEMAASVIGVKPHIIPDVLYPAVANIMVDGTTALSAVTTGPNSSTVTSSKYGTVQSDGRMYYYTDIKGSKPIKDPRIGSYFGSQRHKTKSIQLLEQETATHGLDIFSVDGREWMRGNSSGTNNNDLGNLFKLSLPGNFLEITGYFIDVNVIMYTSASRYFEYQLDGATATTSNLGSATVDTPLSGRYVDSGSVINLGIGASLGIHTIKILYDAGSLLIHGIELIAQDTTSTATKSQIQIPSQNVVSYGKKFTVAETKHYNPFAFKTDGSTAWASGAHNGTAWPIGTGSSTNIDTATSLGLAAWVSTNYYKPYNGGRVVKWIANDGTIKTSVNMMPPNARNIGPTASNEKGDDSAGTTSAAVANTQYLPTFTDQAIDHSQAEVAKTFNFREFGNGGANGNASYIDLSSKVYTNSTLDTAYVMDDGLTSFAGYSYISAANQLSWGAGSQYVYFTFIGTGFSKNSNDSNTTFAQNLPYGTHIVKVNMSASATWYSQITIDGVSLGATLSANYYSFKDITFHQPKMPPIPEDAVVIADYMLMADFVKQSTTVTEGQISKGVRVVNGSRDHFCDGGGAFGGSVAILATSLQGLYAFRSGTGSTAQLPFFGTRFLAGMEGSDVSHELTINGTAVTEDVYDCSANTQMDLKGIPDASVATLGLNTAKTALNSGSYRYWGTHVDSPIHTSSHYQTFETPFLHELVGGDRNMEQTNLVVTPDGKTWDEVTRDVSYIGKARVRGFSLAVMALTDNTTWFNWAVRGGTVDSSVAEGEKRGAFYNKDFAVAYDRFICLKDGQYVIHSMQSTSQNTDLLINGAVFQAMTAGGDSTTESLSVPVNLKRGDYIQKVGGYNNPADNEWSAFEIWSL